MKAVILVLISALSFATCGSGNSNNEKSGGAADIVISGKVNHPGSGKIYISELRPDRTGWKDSIELNKDNTFKKKIHLTEPGYFSLNFYDRQMFNVIFSKYDVTINVDMDSQDGKPQIVGSPEHDVVNKVQEMLLASQNSPEIDKLKEEFGVAVAAGDNARIAALQAKYLGFMKRDNDSIAAIINRQPASLALVELLGQGNILSKDEYGPVYQKAADKLKKDLPSSVFVKPFLESVEKDKALAVGSVAPEITMPDPSGRIIKLSSLRGKYVLVDFWAKWCGPCRRENPNVVKAYLKYKDKGFEVFGVSLDQDKADWIQAIKDDGLVWTQVSDLRYFESRAAKDYGINSIPFSILLDPKGVIVAKNLRGPALEGKLEEIFAKK